MGENGPTFDSHCHAWRRWPYAPLVPDEDTRGTVAALLYELDRHGIDQALVICASIDNNPDNVDYVSFAAERYFGRLHVVADLDCVWSADYHRPGSAQRMRALCDRHDLVGITHYLGKENDGWLLSDDAEAVFALAAQRNLVISLGAGSDWHGDLRLIARRHPTVSILCHSLGGIWIEDGQVNGLSQVLASAETPNIYIKVAGLHYCSPSGWEYPWRDTVGALEQIYRSYGPARLCWGSDFPAATRFCTFRQTLEVIRSHCPFLSEDDRRLVFGENLRNLLSRAR